MIDDDSPELAALASGVLDDEDALVLSRARHMYEALDPVPAGLLDRISFAITLEALDAEIAILQENGAGLAMARGGSTGELRSLTFQSDTATTIVTISSLGFDKRRIEGWVVPGAGAHVTLRERAAERDAIADTDGHFVFDDLDSGRVSIHIARADRDGRPIVIPDFDV